MTFMTSHSIYLLYIYTYYILINLEHKNDSTFIEQDNFVDMCP